LGGAQNQVAFWSTFVDFNNQTLTPNTDTIYFNPFYDTKNGPVVLEIPSANGGSITGSIDGLWQTALEDVGPAGVDKGTGGKYLILPPDHDGATPEGYIPLQSDTYQGYALLRSNVKSGSDADVSKAVAYGKRIRLYPLSEAANPPETRFVDMAGRLYDATIPYDRSFFVSLARIVDYEPWLTRDRAMIDPLKSLGIEKGKSFEPDSSTQTLFDEAAKEAQSQIDARREALFAQPFYAGAHWVFPADKVVVEGTTNFYTTPEAYPVDGRAVTYSMAFFSPKHLGTGQYYLMTLHDDGGDPLSGASTYCLRVPPDAPVTLYWSATAYDRETHALIRDVPRASRGSNSVGIETNADGSVDIWFGPNAPDRKGNWIPTRTDRKFEVLFRFYGPEKPLFDKSWKLPDIEKIA